MKLRKKKNKNAIPKKYNYGLGLFKTISAFGVVRAHSFNYNSTKNKIILYILRKRGFHVNSFFIMSFYFMYKDLLSSNINIFIKRIERLLIPYIIWPFFFFILNNYILKILFPIKKYSFNDLRKQYLTGNCTLNVLWFQWNLIVLTTIFFFIIYFYKKKYYLFLLQLLGCFGFFIQYSGYNGKLIEKLSQEKKYTIGGFFVALPLASTGFTFASLNVINIVSNYKLQTMFFSLFGFLLLEKYSIFQEAPNKVGNSGILYHVRAICFIFIFSLFPSNKITDNKLEKILKHITNYTAGIYYIHMPIMNYLKYLINPIKNGTCFGILIIYLISYLICLIGMQLFGKTKLKNLFS